MDICLSMYQEVKYYTADGIADALGVNTESVHRWVDSGKLKYSLIEDGVKKFSISNLSEFAVKYNISMKFIDSVHNRLVRTTKRSFVTTATK